MAKYLIKIPTNCSPDEADRWRVVDAALKAITLTNNKVDSPISGLSAGGGGKVKINQYDSTAEYLEKKIVESNSTTFVQSNDGLGAKEIKIHSTVIEDTTVPADIIAGELFFDTDARFGTPFTIGDGEAGIDYEIKVDGETNDSSIFWMEDEDQFKFADRLQTDGGRIGKITTVTDTYIILISDESIICNKATAFTVTLPTATVGQKYEISNINTGTATVEGASSDTIDGALNITLGQWDNVILQCYAANSWKVK